MQTVLNRAHGDSGTRAEGHAKPHLLTPAQEATLIEWCQLHSGSATLLHVTNLRSCVFEICGKQPGKNWARRFIQRSPHLVSAKPRGLDPKRAQNFNRNH
ncbi:hypothetical protein PAXRUDRAFT_828064 [Paxillus rubicundulus Ve08.2h10]|uniref:HTH CENPB-type domain-containing protein n=1 Tax=Paxillus rubicundulus Ve08.2h10 TaxID=930991 RepID=A0A0D0DWP9_9AGAM|nr:hypothetical protein PAXRUDRAFT_828064 [Paxillus rubicundulus Ve08.2h10]